MFSNFTSVRTKTTLAKMLGNLTPAEICEVIEDKEVAKTDIPAWTELVIQENCTMVMERLQLYNESILKKYGAVQFTVQKLSIYHKIWTNWDDKEPCPCENNMTLDFFYDTAIQLRRMTNKYHE